MEYSVGDQKPEFTIRKMEVLDIKEVYAIESEAFSLPWSIAAFQSELLQNLMARYFVLENSQAEIVGYAGIWFVVDEAHITTIAVKKTYQGQGLGKLLLQRIITETWALGGKKLMLEVRVSNEIAIAMYRKFGFVAQGIRKKYYSDNQEDALIMWAVIE